MTRSATPDGNRRDKWLHLKVSPSERDFLKQAAASRGTTVSDLVRASIGQSTTGVTPRDTRPARRSDPALLAALGRIGNNLNQIGRWCNRHQAGADAVQVLASLAAIDRSIKALIPQHPGGRPPKDNTNPDPDEPEDDDDAGATV